MSDKITTLHPKNNLNVNVYPNVKDENIPDTILRVADLGDSINDLGDYTFVNSITFSDPVTFSSAVDVEGKATFGSDAEVDGTLTINSATDLVIKDGTTFAQASYDALDTKIEANTTLINTKADSSDLTSFEKNYYANAYRWRFCGGHLQGYEQVGAGESYADFDMDVALPDAKYATDFRGCFQACYFNSDNCTLWLPSFTKSTRSSPINMVVCFRGYTAANTSGSIKFRPGYYNNFGLSLASHLTSVETSGTGTVYIVGDQTYSLFGCSILTTVGDFDMTYANTFTGVFLGCTSLKTLHCLHWKYSFNISASTQFEEDDLVEIIGNLDTVSTAQTLTMGSTNLAKLTQDEILVATGKGWTLA